MSHYEVEVAQLRMEICNLKYTRDTFQQRRDALQAFKIQEQSLFAPIRKIPTEIMEWIIVLGQVNGENGDDAFTVCTDPHDYLRTVTQVCCHWRSIAHSCATIWARIRIGKRPLYSSPYKAESWIEKCLSLCKDIPFTLLLDRQFSASPLGMESLKAIAKNASTCREIALPNNSLYDDILKDISEGVSLKNLEILSFAMLSTSVTVCSAPRLKYLKVWNITNSSVTVTLGSQPSLRQLELSNSPRSPLQIFVGLHWSQLTHFASRFVRYSNDELCEVFGEMPYLKVLHFAGHTNTARSILLTALETLELGEMSGPDEQMYELMDMLKTFITPSLQSLYVNQDIETDYVVDFLQLSKTPLRELRLNGLQVYELWNIPELSQVRKLNWMCSELERDNLYITEVLHQLTRRSGEYHTIFPMMESLTISGIDLTRARESHLTAIENALISLVEDRYQPLLDSPAASLSLKSLEIQFCGFQLDMMRTFWNLVRLDEKEYLEVIIRTDQGTIFKSRLA